MSQRLALVGMPNVGKTALFNALTGSHQKVANFPGITVERKSGWIGEKAVEIIDLPGIYSLDATTLDEKVTKDFLLQKKGAPEAGHFVLVLDATNLDKSLFLAFQLKELGYRLTIALNLMDEARKRGLELDLEKLSTALDARIFPTSAATGEGVEEIRAFLLRGDFPQTQVQTPPNFQKLFRSPAYVNGIFRKVDELLSTVVRSRLRADKFSDRLDHFVLHPVYGVIILTVLLLLIFQMLFTWAAPLQDLIEALFSYLGDFAATTITQPLIKSLVVDGMISGVGSVVVFLPQILILFFFIQLLEDLGYLGRAAFLMDSLFRKFGLPGKSVIPLLSSHACAIPGVLSTRIIDSNRERLITMLIVPLTTCSARLPVYAVLIGALIPNQGFWGQELIKLPGLVLFGLYALGLITALIVSLILKRALPHESPSMLLMELPPYRIPKARNLFLTMKNKAKIFLTTAGGIIFVLSLLIWVLVTFPQVNGESVIEQSYAAHIGHFFEPVFRPLGFDWKMTTALIPSIAAREVMVSALSLVMSVEEGSVGFEASLSKTLLAQYGFGALSALLIWFVFAPQCISTFAVIKRESNSYKWPIVMVLYTLALAYGLAWLTRILISSWS